MNATEWNDEYRSALEDSTEAEKSSGCRHSFGRHGNCYSCGVTAEEMGYVR